MKKIIYFILAIAIFSNCANDETESSKDEDSSNDETIELSENAKRIVSILDDFETIEYPYTFDCENNKFDSFISEENHEFLQACMTENPDFSSVETGEHLIPFFKSTSTQNYHLFVAHVYNEKIDMSDATVIFSIDYEGKIIEEKYICDNWEFDYEGYKEKCIFNTNSDFTILSEFYLISEDFSESILTKTIEINYEIDENGNFVDGEETITKIFEVKYDEDDFVIPYKDKRYDKE